MKFDQEKNFRDWMKFLDADEVRFQLISASLYLTAYDLLVNSVIEKIKDFYITGFDEGGLMDIGQFAGNYPRWPYQYQGDGFLLDFGEPPTL